MTSHAETGRDEAQGGEEQVTTLLAVPFTGTGDGLRGPMSDGDARVANQYSHSTFLRRTKPTQSELNTPRYRNLLLLGADRPYRVLGRWLGLSCLLAGLALGSLDWLG